MFYSPCSQPRFSPQPAVSGRGCTPPVDHLEPGHLSAGARGRDRATLRGISSAGEDISRLGWERPGEIADIVDRAEQRIFELAQQRVTSDFAHIEELLKESFERITKLYEAGVDITGVASGFREL